MDLLFKYPVPLVLLPWDILQAFCVNEVKKGIYVKKPPSKGLSGIHFIPDNASSRKSEVVKSFFCVWERQRFQSSTVLTRSQFLRLFLISKIKKCSLDGNINPDLLLAASVISDWYRYMKRTFFLLSKIEDYKSDFR